jgi:hypothetical protein
MLLWWNYSCECDAADEINLKKSSCALRPYTIHIVANNLL